MFCSLLLLVPCVTGLLGGPIDNVDDEFGCGHAKTAARIWAADLRAPDAEGLNDQTDALHYALDIEIDPHTEWIGGSNTMTVRSLVSDLTVFRFRLQDVFNVSAVECAAIPASWVRIDGATIEVTLDRTYGIDEQFDLYVAYEGFPSPPPGGFGSIEFRSRSGAMEVWTLSEPWFSYTWWPGKDDNTDKTTADLWFTFPDDMVVASNGTLEGVDDLGGGRHRYRWRTQYQTADYLYCIGATNYDTFGGTWQYDTFSMPLDLYIYPEDNTQSNRNAWLENLDMLDVFSDRYGIYPFVDEKYGMCQVGFGGGMEHQTMTSQGGFWESITAHELAHQWWGDMVTCATWHDIWLNEGFATFSEAIWYGDRPGGTMADYHARMDARRPTSVGDSVYVYDIGDVGRIFSSNFTYRKAAWVLHMLRHAVGDQTFFDILAMYRAVYQYGSATTDDLRAVAEGVYGADLGWFFDEWIYDIGAPAYRSAWRQHDVDGRKYIELYIQQVQSGNYPTFIMPLDAAMSTTGGAALEVVWNDARAEHLLFEVSADVLSLELDPEDWVLATSNSTTGFVEGPPKIVRVDPPPGGDLVASDISIVFHKEVVAGAIDFALVGDLVGAVPFSFGYDPGSRTVTLTPDEPLSADAYTLTAFDSIVDVAAGRALDGEIVDAMEPGSLPSGDGLPGGDAVTRFGVFMTLPESFDVVYGVHRSGSLEDLHLSDDGYVVIEQRPAVSVLLPLIRMAVTGSATQDTPSTVTVIVETATTSLPDQPPQSLLLFNYDSSMWEVVDQRTTTLIDSVIEITISANAGRFVESGTGAMQMRIDWFDPGNVFLPAWTVRIDQAIWTVVP